jgi:hypothetical protein
MKIAMKQPIKNADIKNPNFIVFSQNNQIHMDVMGYWQVQNRKVQNRQVQNRVTINPPEILELAQITKAISGTLLRSDSISTS